MQLEQLEAPTQADESSSVGWLSNFGAELTDPKWAPKLQKLERDARRLCEELSGVPFYAKQAKAWEERTGDPMAYWRHSLRPNAYGNAP